MKARHRWPARLATLLLVALVASGCRLANRRPARSPLRAPSASDTPSPSAAAPVIAGAPSPTARAASPWAPPSATRRAIAAGREEPTSDEKTTTADIAATLGSLERVDDYPLYTMRYRGPYTRTAWSAIGGTWMTPRSPVPSWGCSLFAALGDKQHQVYGRNFDWRYSPALLLFTDPPDGFASVSMVDIAYLVAPDEVDQLMEVPLQQREALLETPFWPFDGMNEHGLVVGMAAVPESEMTHDPHKATIDSLLVIREMLDHARDVDQAVAILEQYNVAWGGGPPLHYLIADRAGRATLVEFYDGEMVMIPSRPESPWHLATNHLRAAIGNVGSGGCWRYETILRRLTRTDGSLSAPEALDLLAEVAQENTQWSVVYDLGAGDVYVAVGRAYGQVHVFDLADWRGH